PARHPNLDLNDPVQGGWLWAKPLPDGGNLLQQLAYDPADFPSDGQPTAGQKVTVFNANNWSNNVLTIASVDPTKHIITFAKPATYYFGPGSRYFVSGSSAFLDQPGEWYFDQATKVLYFRPPTGFDGHDVVVAGALDLINISDANNIAIKGLSFADIGSKASDESAISTAAVAIHNSSGVVVEACDFKYVSQGVRITGTSNNNTVASNDFSNLWGPAASIGRGTSHNFITNNSIKNSGEVFAGSAAIQLENTYGNTIAKNDIRDVPRAGIAVTHSDAGVKSGGNVIEDNSVVDSGRMTDHSGAIYAVSFVEKATLSNTISGNTIVNTGGLSTADSGFVSEQRASAGIYLEGVSSGSKIFGNTIKGTALAGIFLLGSDNNDVHDNVVSVDSSVVGKASAVSVVPVGSEGGSGNDINNNSI
ncbi:MAG: right-handed parallel beta-helix repeat-containing protein, partial [Hyphomicrobiales bacterium]|nr:right-handed parallel beta-helix repeat-containing protein [Hyphomicrobiales bacterium]